MFNSILGTVNTGKTKRRIEVKWDSHCKKVYVAFGGWTFIGKAYSAKDAMNMAEAWLYNK